PPPPPPPRAAAAHKTTAAAGVAPAGATPFLAYGKSESSGPLRTLVGGPPPRFFPQAARTTLGERMAQAFAFLFVQDYERVALVTPGYAGLTPARVAAAFAALDGHAVSIDAGDDGYLIALRRADFPQIAPIFEEVTWEDAGAKAAAERVLDQNGVKA
ncbi:MAG: DUF2064 domain-containing protein, partial [Candidatus Sericytochromatia bacterium]